MARVTGIRDCGSIIMMKLSDGQMVNWDRRCYGDFLEGMANQQGIEPGGTVDLRDIEVEYTDGRLVVV